MLTANYEDVVKKYKPDLPLETITMAKPLMNKTSMLPPMLPPKMQTNYLGINYRPVNDTAYRNLNAIQPLINRIQNNYCNQFGQELVNILAFSSVKMLEESKKSGPLTTKDVINRNNDDINKFFKQLNFNKLNVSDKEKDGYKNDLKKLSSVIIDTSSTNGYVDAKKFIKNMSDMLNSICPNTSRMKPNTGPIPGPIPGPRASKSKFGSMSTTNKALIAVAVLALLGGAFYCYKKRKPSFGKRRRR